MKKVLVLDANQRSALATTRSLGKQFISVFTADETPDALAGFSKFSIQYFTYPSPKKQPEQFVKALANLVEEHNIEVLLPMTELTSSLLLQNQALFPNSIIPLPDIETVESLSNKSLLMKRAESLAISIPQTWYVDDPAALPCDIDQLAYPI
ncbi:ATP-dependent carboxylate-amine ligase, partial [bacterium]|nr:ATP-dependent carboxylate-amine ligase [bacterium]